MFSRILMIMVFLMSPTYVLVAGMDNPQYIIMVGLSGGLKKVDYGEINDQLKKYHGIDGINYLPNPGIEGTFRYRRLVFNTSILRSFSNLERKGRVFPISKAKVSFSGLSNFIKIGILPFASSENIFFPYIGLDLEYLWIKADINYGIRCLNCFFQYDNRYWIYNIGFTYGIAYTKLIKLKKGWPIDLAIGIDGGGIMALTDNCWKVNGKKVEYTYGRDIPQFDLKGYFFKVQLVFLVLKR